MCASCEYWMGERAIDMMRLNVLFRSIDVRGVCGNMYSPFYRGEVMLRSGCNNWEKWRVLR